VLANTTGSSNQDEKNTSSNNQISVPSISLPKGGGAIRGIGEKFAANPVTGTGSMTVPIATSLGRSGFGPQLSLSYDSGAGNGSFGLGWSLSLPAITRKTDKGLPHYFDGGKDQPDSDVFILSGAEDLVSVLTKDTLGNWKLKDVSSPDGEYVIRRYQPRIEGLFVRIERWTRSDGDVHWRSISKDNMLTLYGKDENSRIYDPDNLQHIFSWLICETRDDKGNAIVYKYKAEDGEGVDLAQAHEQNRGERRSTRRNANRYLKSIHYGNRNTLLDHSGNRPRFVEQDPWDKADWMFEVVFDYGEGYDADVPSNVDHCHYLESKPDADDRIFVQANMTLPTNAQYWPVRQDPFSSYRAGFEVRTYRLCRRVLMFHHFPQELGINDYLVRSTEFTYSPSPIASFITGVTQSGYLSQPTPNQANRYLKKSLPPVEFEYSQVPLPDEFAVLPIQEVDAESLENLPIGLDGANYQWMDLDGEGTSGILTEQANGWFYKRNLSANHQLKDNGKAPTVAMFGPMEVVASKPAAGLGDGAQFLDLAGDGQVDLVQMVGSERGFYERTENANWEPFQAFTSWPNVNTRDPNLKFVDLTGDGHADILISDDDVFQWHESLAEEGFGPVERVYQALDEEKGPRLVFADGTDSMYLADMSGDGLTDLARIRNGEVCFWPNLGYGRFGAKVTMDHTPWFDAPDQFHQRRIRLVDIDGSGTTDIVYLHRDGVHIYFNQSGNRWSDAVELRQFPAVNDITSVQALDLLGNGTGCLVWSSALPGDARRPMRYIALMEEKPHLLIGVKNNLGAETIVKYAPSTKFYLDDKEAGNPWVTRLPFPVHVVERIETHDYISRNRFVTLYKYHHGYFDGEEREFRGFGMVEQQDTEEFAALSASENFPVGDNVDESTHVPPILTKTWFHTGAYIEGERISRHFEHEYYREGDVSRGESGLSDLQLEAILLDDTVFPITIRLSDGTRQPYSLLGDEFREASRSLKGAILRQEIYSLDKNPDGTLTDESDRPYSVSERNYTIELLQPRSSNQHAIFFTHAREQVDFHYERKLVDVNGEKRADPRVTHSLTLEVDAYGNMLCTLTIGYPRRDLPLVTEAEQKETHMTLIVNRVANIANETDWYRIGVPVETRTYEIVKPPEPSTSDFLIPFFKFDAMSVLINGLFPLEQAEPDEHKLWPYEKWDWRTNNANVPAETRLRLIEHVRSLYRRNTLNGFSPLGQVESLALPGESYKLAFTPNLLKTIFVESGKLASQDVDTTFGTDGGYVHSEGDTNWWIPSGQIFYSPNTTDSAADELTFAREHFFLPHRYRDPFGNETFVAYDSSANDPTRNHNLLLVETRDALGNIVTVNTEDDSHNTSLRIDYRVLQPYWVTDPNKNRTQVAFDVLGMVAATAVMGKPGEDLGDLLQEVNGDPLPTDLTVTEVQHFAGDPLAQKTDLLGRATTRIVYDLDRWKRETLPPFAATPARETHIHDTGGPQSKIQVSFSYSDGFGREIQKKIQAEPEKVNNVIGPPRWVGSGWTIFNNKGKPVRQYEPFFSTDHQFQFGKKVGVSPVLFYDPVERVVATLHPNHTYEKVVFDPWQQTTYDVNDTATFDPKVDPDVSDFFRRLPDDDYLPTWYERRKDGALGGDEQRAATRTAQHANTPTTAYFDTLGRTFLTVANNGKDINGNDQLYNTKVVLDIEGNQREVIDARSRVVMRYDYDMLSNRIHQASMEAGERWMLNDVVGKPIHAWDSRDHQFRTDYDRLRRPTDSFLREGAGAEMVVGHSIYGESLPNPEATNLRGKVVQIFDQAGTVTSDRYDFKGNLLRSQRQLAQEYKTTLDWSSAVLLEVETYTSRTHYDALNRPTQMIAPHSDQAGVTVNVIEPIYNEANLLEQVHAWLNQNAEPTDWLEPATANLHAVTNIDYDARGQRTQIDFDNGVRTTYEYDPLTFRLVQLLTRRKAVAFPGDCPQPPPAGWPGCQVQNLHYTYDPAGNITHIRDDAQQTIYFRNKRVEPSADYTYDAIYRLIEATGREHLGQVGGTPIPHSYNDAPHVGIVWSANDGNAMGTYLERYVYDTVGNFLSMQHRSSDPAIAGWMRTYTCNEPSQLEPGKQSNRLTSTTIGGTTETYSAAGDGYDAHGNMLRMPHLQVMQWDYKDHLQMTRRQAMNAADADGAQHQGERTWYVYDSAGQRVRRVTELTMGQVKDERIYLGGFEIYRKNGANPLVRETLYIKDDKLRIALVETRIDTPVPQQLIRYQFSNHLGSANLELGHHAQIISYEEYTPYGSTSYQAVGSQTETPKRYRFTGKERDEESGLYYHVARYYVAWLGRWTACDPTALMDGINLYLFTNCNPTRYTDPTGLANFKISMPTFRGEPGLQNADELIQQTFTSGAAPKGGAGAPQTLENLLESINVGSAKSGWVQSSQSVDVAMHFAMGGKGHGGGVVFEILPRPDSVIANLSPIADKIDFPEQRVVAHPGGITPEQYVRAYKIKISKGAKDVIEVVENPNSALNMAAPEKPPSGPTVPEAAAVEGAVVKPAAVEPSSSSPIRTTITDLPSNTSKISSLLDSATPGAAKALAVAGAAYAAYDISTKTAQTTREKGALMGAAQFGKTSAKHATAMLWFAFGATIALSIASGGAATPLAAAAIGTLITAYGMTITHKAIDDLTPGLR